MMQAARSGFSSRDRGKRHLHMPVPCAKSQIDDNDVYMAHMQTEYFLIFWNQHTSHRSVYRPGPMYVHVLHAITS